MSGYSAGDVYCSDANQKQVRTMHNHIYQLVNGRHGRFLVNPHDQYVGRSLIAYGEWGEAEVRLFEQVLRPGDIAVEVGSNIGSHTVPISRAIGKEGVVHAFEPQRLVHQLLCANLALNDCHNVHVRQAAVSNSPGQVEFCSVPPYHELNYGSISVGQSLGGDSTMEQVSMLTIDTLDLPRLDFLKVDAEGHDLKVLQGGQSTIARHRPVIFVEVGEQTCDGLSVFFEDNGYDCWVYCTALFEEQNFLSNAENIWSHLGYLLVSIDLLAVPREQGWEVSGLPSFRDKINWKQLPGVDGRNYRDNLHIRRNTTGSSATEKQ